jgi:hypothetical protein
MRDAPIRIVVWAERAWLATMGALALAGRVSHDTSTLAVLLAISSLGGLVVSAILLLLPTRRPHTLRRVEAVALACIIAGIMGDQFGLYVHVPYYDKFLHVVVPLAITYALFELSQATSWVWSWTKVTPFEVALYLFCIAMTLGTLWELYEFGSDQLFGTHQQGGPHGANFDTMTDLLAVFVGALAGSVSMGIVTVYGHRHGLGTISETRQHLRRRMGARAFARHLAEEHPITPPSGARRHR